MLPYTFSFFDFLHVIEFELLIILFYNFKTQVDSHEILKILQDYSTRWSHRYVKDHVPSRFLTSFLLSARRIEYWISFSFIFFNYFYLFNQIHLKIQGHNMFPWPWLVNIRFDGLIVQTVGPSVFVWECSTLVAGPSRVLQIEHPDVRLLPKLFLYAEAQRRGLNNPGSITAQRLTTSSILFLLLFPFLSTPASFLFKFWFHVLWLAQEHMCNHMSIG